MKKIISAIFVVMLLIASTVSCKKEDPGKEHSGNKSTEYTFEISVKGESGFKDVEGKSMKTVWGKEDKIFMFFKSSGGSMLKDTYATMSYNGTSWTTILTGKSSLGSGGNISAVYVPYIGNKVTPEFKEDKWTVQCGDVFYSCADKVEYKVESGKVKADLNMTIPKDYVQFYISGIESTDILTCNNVDSFSDITIDGSLAVTSKTKTKDGKMNGRQFNNGIVFYGRLISTLPADCHLSVTKGGQTYRRVLTGKKLEHKAYKFDDLSTEWDPILLSGKFSVSADKKVCFSYSNLCWTGSAFVFEKDQFSYPTSWDNQHVGHFYWAPAADKAYAENYNVSGQLSDKLFTNATDGLTVYGQTGWRTLSTDEWKYLLLGTSDDRKGKSLCPVNVAGQIGLVIAPDSFTGKINNNYTANEWATVEKNNGLVFLPKANNRKGKIINSQNAGHYWTSTNSGKEVADYFTITDDFDDENFDAGDKSTGRSIRLVQNAAD